MKLARHAGGSEFGGAMIIALVVVLVVTGLGMTFLQLNLAITERVGQSAHDKRAFYIAEAGLAEAYWGLGAGKSGEVGSVAAPASFGNGLFWVERTDEGGGVLRLESTGMYGRGRATLALTVQAVEETVEPPSGLVSLGGFRVREGSMIDGYDSSLGSYAGQIVPLSLPPHADAGAVIRSNGDVIVEGSFFRPSHVFGDVIAGPGDTVSTSLFGRVHGNTSAADTPIELPPVELPTIAQTTDLDHDDLTPRVIAAGDHGYTELRVGSHATVILQGPMTLLVDELELDWRARLLLDDTGGPIQIFVRDSLELESGSVLTSQTQDPTSVTIHVAADDTGSGDRSIHLAADTDFHGSIYGPLASAYVSRDFELFGGLAVARASLDESVRMHLDTQLAVQGGVREPEVLAWRIVQSPGPVASKRTDPWSILGVDAASARSPAESHSAIWIRVTWLAIPVGSYEGWDNAFDATSIDGVVLTYNAWTGPDKSTPLKTSLLGL